MPVIGLKLYTTEIVHAHPEWLFLFGDNADRIGRGGQAFACRDESNCQGVRTKWHPNARPTAFFTDEHYDRCCAMIDDDLSPAFRAVAEGRTVVIPEDGIGTGFARLPVIAPRIFSYLSERLSALKTAGERMDPSSLFPESRQITREEASELQQAAIGEGELLIWTIYRNPRDFPGRYVARPFGTRAGVARVECLVAHTLAGIRRILPPGLTWMDRDESDDIAIVETWV